MNNRKNVEELDSNMLIHPLGDLDYTWLDPINTSEIKLSGFCWIEKDKLYRRMPKDGEISLPSSVDVLANCCTGGQMKFQTDSTGIAIDAKFANKHTMYHMPPTGQLGFDCYMGECGDMKFVGIIKFAADAQEYRLPIFENVEKMMRTITINFPLYNDSLNHLKIGIESGAKLIKPKNNSIDRRIVIYGTSLTQGGCASRPGMCYSNILSRQIDAEFVNLGFSGNGLGEPEVMNTIANIENMGLFVMDYEGNIQDKIYENLAPSIDIIRSKHPLLPIIILSCIAYGQENISPAGRDSASKRRKFQQEFVSKRTDTGDENIYFVDGNALLEGDPGEYGVDGSHLTDFGFHMMAENLLPVMKDIMVN